MRREITIVNHSKNKNVGRVILEDDGSVSFKGLPSLLQEQLEHGIRDWDTENQRIMPTEGDRFMNAVITEFSGGYVRAVETTKQ